jgi:hypothetical protein
MSESDPTPEYLKPWFDLGRVTAGQAQQRLAAGLFCAVCKAANKKLKPIPQRKTGYHCSTCGRAHRRTASAKSRDARQRRVYGITLEEALAIEEHQGGGCICAPWTNYDGSGGRSLSTDHDHKTGEVRGRLCKHCNDLLGRIRDDITYFKAMIHYLENPPAKEVLGTRVVPDHPSTAG